jgi:hypothetical protein
VACVRSPTSPNPDPGKQPHAGREHERGRGLAGDDGHEVAAVQPVDRPRSQPHRGEHDHRTSAAAKRMAGDPADPGHRSVLIGAAPERGLLLDPVEM